MHWEIYTPIFIVPEIVIFWWDGEEGIHWEIHTPLLMASWIVNCYWGGGVRCTEKCIPPISSILNSYLLLRRRWGKSGLGNLHILITGILDCDLVV